MATQTVEFRSPPSQTVTAKLFAIGSDTQVASVSTTEATNRKGTYSAAYTDVAAGEYELIALVGAVPVARWFVTLTLTTATFQARDKVGAVELDSSTQTQIDTIESTVSSIGSQATTVERSVSDTNAITFAWPVSGATITGTRSLNNGSYGAVTGAIAFLRSETGKHYYTLAYNSADRLAAEGQVRYKFIDGTYTGYVVLRVAQDGLDSDAQAQLQSIEDGVDANTGYLTTVLARLGAWTGTGINTILGGIRAIAAKAASLTPTDLSTGTTFNNTAHSIEAVATITPQRPATLLERPPTDTGVITFAWPVSGATITGTVSLNNAAYIPVTGGFLFLRTDGGKHFYTLAHNTADRPVTAGSARYALTDGVYTRYMVLRVVESGDTGETTALAMLCFDWETITGEVPSRSVLNALRHIRNKWALDGTTKTVYAEDDTTPAFTSTVTADGAGNITADTPN